jgi:L-cysteine:1D-myo-inositol 2-amino-2-deoxy-alpha-D-glucopyranoside ligase
VQSWQVTPVKPLPGRGSTVSVFDTATGSVTATEPRDGTARMYVCGITPYDATHMGHAATYLAFDLLNRAWRDAGFNVNYVQNVTDVDDPLLERAVATGQDWRELAARETALFREDMTALNVIPPEHYLGAVESIPLVIDWIRTLMDRGAAYQVDSDLYFRVDHDKSFGSIASLSKSDMLTLFAQRGGDPDRPGKESPLDCLLWQAERPDEPAWDGALGHGRPGWHIECVAIALTHLGMSFDVQGGGRDLAFPHHEMGASQAHVATDEHPYAHAYVHAGMIGLDGEKMSKSKGNLVLVSLLRDSGVDPMAIRLALLSGHYRDDRDWTDELLVRAQSRLLAWRQTLESPTPESSTLLAQMRESLSNDLDSPAALTAIDAWMSQAESGLGPRSHEHSAEVMTMIDTLLGVRL